MVPYGQGKNEVKVIRSVFGLAKKSEGVSLNGVGDFIFLIDRIALIKHRIILLTGLIDS